GRWHSCLHGSVPPSVGRRPVRTWIAIHLQEAIDEVHDPVVLNACPCVEATLVFAVEGETRIGHLDGKRWTCRVRLAIVGAVSRYHDQIGCRRASALR